MPKTILLVKNMVCNRCVSTVETILDRGKILFHKVVIGEIHLDEPLNELKRKYLVQEFLKTGFEIIDNHVGALIEKIKQLTIKKARNESEVKEGKIKLSEYLSGKLNYEYTHLSSIFSSVEGRTIENFFIEQRIEKAKELLVYNQMTLSEISFELDYSSVAHLSSQFKKVTGLTPTFFKEVGSSKRKPLDEV